MSLVNKMLRDLDARRAGEGDRAGLPAAVTPLAARREPSRSLPRLWLGLALAAAVGGAAWYATQTGNQEVSVARPVAVAPAAPVVAAAPVTPTSAEPVSVAAPAPVASLEPSSLRMADALSAMPELAVEPPRKVPPRKVPVAAPKTPQKPVVSAVAPLRPLVVALPKVPPVSADAHINKQERLPSPAERAEIEYRRGVLAQRQGNAEDAAGSYRAALTHYPEHAAARQTLAALLIDAKHFDDAEELLRKGAELAPVRMASTLALARLKVERNQAPEALELLQKNAASGERSAEYQGFAAALLNRAGRAAEAVEHYQAATRLAPNEGRWWAGLGIALDAAGKSPEAREAYQKARALPGLPADLAQHIEQRLR
ncbi:MAG: tetratricopeptide repeat protein [Rhodocyclales bacterium]|nr:tetratricopeptide repeat protein [Rhodocyclales bacterium]